MDSKTALDEKVWLHSLRFIQTSTASASDVGVRLVGSAAITSHVRFHCLPVGRKLIASCIPHSRMLVSCAKTSEAVVASSEKQSQRRATFPNGFKALFLEVCDETDIAELKLKVGDFEMHLKRNIEVAKAPAPLVPAAVQPLPVPTKQVESASPAAVSSPPKSSPGSPFVNVSQKTSILAALEASGATNYVVVTSPEVGIFRSGRTVKGKKQPPSCKPGDVIKEGQVIGFLEQFGHESPVKSDASGEVLKVLFEDGEPIGYGDPLIAVSSSSHGIKHRKLAGLGLRGLTTEQAGPMPPKIARLT
ncbi:Biotin/lipoyl attachment [Dillenia turbinata]|uniref:Biotin/lipoyl attachment n=1 Tax=Dillenia turbinata TaxID=194707 RepID=A0AAN8ZFR8_9MAGN